MKPLFVHIIPKWGDVCAMDAARISLFDDPFRSFLLVSMGVRPSAGVLGRGSCIEITGGFALAYLKTAIESVFFLKKVGKSLKIVLFFLEK